MAQFFNVKNETQKILKTTKVPTGLFRKKMMRAHCTASQMTETDIDEPIAFDEAEMYIYTYDHELELEHASYDTKQDVRVDAKPQKTIARRAH
jgi:hypothetical protein